MLSIIVGCNSNQFKNKYKQKVSEESMDSLNTNEMEEENKRVSSIFLKDFFTDSTKILETKEKINLKLNFLNLLIIIS